MAEFKIGNKWVGDGHPAFIVAEIGNNHNGDLELAKKLIERAGECGADAVKFQVKDVETAFPKELLDMPYSGPHSFGRTYREHKLALEFSHAEFAALAEHAKLVGITFFATPFERKSLSFLETLDPPALKIASFHVHDLDFVADAAALGKPVVVSTGMSTLEEVDAAVEVLRRSGADFAVLQCTSSYPTDDKDVNLAVIRAYKERYGCVVGYSGHDRGITIPAASVCFGAKIIEKHFTLDRTMRGTDHACSLEPKGFAMMVERTRLIEAATGSPEKRLLECELATKRKNRARPER